MSLIQTKPLYRNIKLANNFDAVRTMDELKALVDNLYSSDKLIGFDIETGYTGADYENRSTNPYHPLQFIAGFSITNDVTWARYVPLKHDFYDNLDSEEAWAIVKPLLEEKAGVAHNISFEASNLRQLDNHGDGPRIVIPVSKWHDSMIQAYVLSDIPPMPVDGSLPSRLDGAIDPGGLVRRYIPEFHRDANGYQDMEIKAFQVNLKSLTKFRYDYNQADIHSLFNNDKELTAKQKRCIRFNTLPVEPNVIKYACDDAYLCLQLSNDQMGRINEDDYLPRVYRVEMEIAEMLVDMAESGVNVDWEGIRENKKIFDEFSHNLRVDTKEKFEIESGRNLSELNFNSPTQMSKLIFGSHEEGGLGLTAVVKTDSGANSTNDKALTSLKKQSPAITSLLNYRKCIKMGEWFTQWTELESQSFDAKIHPAFIQVRVQSGRFASANPNVQNITKRWWFQRPDGSVAEVMENSTNGEDYWTGNARDFIIPSEGYKILSFDYKSAEIQMLAALAMENEIVEAFRNGEDFHKWTASLVFGKPIDQVTKNERQAAKAQPLTEPILTPHGWVKMGDLKVGDEVIGSDGKPTKVVGISPRWNKEIYKVTTSDGETRCTEDHLWTVRYYDHRHPWKTVPLSELIKKETRTGYHSGNVGQYRWELPDRPVVEYAPREEPLPVDPYILGLILGDGGLTHDWAPTFCSADPELITAVTEYHESLGGRVENRKRGDENFWVLYLACAKDSEDSGSKRNPLRSRINSLGLNNANHKTKFVPDMYLRTTPGERLAILQGLLDTDGTPLNSGAEFVSTSKALAEAVVELARSLGGRATLYDLGIPPMLDGSLGSSKSPTWKVYLRLPEELSPFRLSRKAALVKTPGRPIHSRIRSVEKIGVEECQCIKVENEDGLYVTNDFIVTHNTISFASVYGSSVGSMAQSLGISLKEMTAIYEAYFNRFPKLRKYFENQHDLVLNTNEVRTWLGRKAVIWESMHEKGGVRNKAERMSVNIPVQGGATGDYTKLAMIKVYKALKATGQWGNEIRMLMNQHDSLVFEVKDTLDIDEVIKFITPLVQFDLTGVQGCFNEFPTFPPMSVDWEVGNTWGSVTDVSGIDDLSATKLEIIENEPISVQELAAIKSVLVTNPGPVPVSLFSGGKENILRFSVKAHPDVVSKILHGDPDIGIVGSPAPGKIDARFTK